ncbi:ADP-ribosylglycohydrolase family protein [Prosthecobacter sp.]|uniref:ADP-ribosylglycohydrolase family protein n=1 Tax=Prosthecobacter sp. TaxID=1965333 RepID=UPI00378306FB
MTSDFSSRLAGMLQGSFIAESLSLGVHWIYDPALIQKKHGRVTGYLAPSADSYHPHKQAGEQGHAGDQALRLLAFLQRERRWDAAAFLADWQAMWPSYNDYVDKATKGTLTNLQAGATVATSGAPSDELAGPARIAPLMAFLADKPESEAVAAAIEQTVITHRSPETVECAEFLARATQRLLHGGELQSVITETAPAWALKAAEGVGDEDAIGQLGRACPLPQALPAVLWLVRHHGNDFAKAVIENAMAGGDNCARALALGMLLGAAHGIEAIPAAWREGLRAKEALEGFLQALR